MKLLGIDTTGGAMSAAVTDGTRLLAEVYAENGNKHSKTLMPAVDAALRFAGIELKDVDGVAVSVGPGSFTGIRIGVAAASALAYAAEKPSYAVNTLDAILKNVEPGAVGCAVMDARRGEVYAAAKRGGDYIVEPCAIPLDVLLEELALYDGVVFAGDAAARFRETILEKKPDSLFAPPQFILQRASSVCMCAAAGIAEKVAHDGIKPYYLRESQAERVKRENGTR